MDLAAFLYSDFHAVWRGCRDLGFDISVFEAKHVYDIIWHSKAPFIRIDARQNLKEKS